MAMEDLGGEMGNLSEEMEDNSVTDQNQRDIKTKIDNTKPEDLDGLQMLRLPQEDDKTLLKKDILPVSDESIDQEPADDFKHEVKCFQVAKPVIRVSTDIDQDDNTLEEPKVDSVIEESHHDEKPNIQIASEQEMVIRRSQKYKGVDGAVKPALVKKEVSELYGLTERQQKILQDFHVKFVLEGVSVEEDDESRARKHSEFVELKKRLEEEEKMYAGCALGEASDIIDGTDKDQIDVDPSTRNVTATHVPDEDIDSSSPADVAVRATMDGVINSLAEVAICRRESSPEEDVKPQTRPQNVRNAMKGLADDDDGPSELQEYTNREGSVGCQVWLLL